MLFSNFGRRRQGDGNSGPPVPTRKHDVEMGDPVDSLVAGYPRLAGHIERLPEVGIFRRFGALNARSLYYRQAELIDLEFKLKKAEKEDAHSGDEKREQYSKDWYWLKDSEDSENPEASKQWRLVQIIMEKLRLYSKNILHFELQCCNFCEKLPCRTLPICLT